MSSDVELLQGAFDLILLRARSRKKPSGGGVWPDLSTLFCSTSRSDVSALRCTAMIVTTLILASGFAILAMSSFLPNSTMSLLTTIAILLALPVDLLLLPLLVLLVDREKYPAEETSESLNEPVPATK